MVQDLLRSFLGMGAVGTHLDQMTLNLRILFDRKAWDSHTCGALFLHEFCVCMLCVCVCVCVCDSQEVLRMDL